MSRSGYTDDCDGSDLAMWRGVVASATRGKRGQKFFRDLVAALDEMPVKRLIKGDLESEEGETCALGSLGRKRGVDLLPLDEALDDECSNFAPLAAAFDIAEQLAQETMYVNDEGGPHRPWRRDGYRWVRDEETTEERWTRVREWAARQIRVTEDELLPEPEAPAAPPLLEKLPR